MCDRWCNTIVALNYISNIQRVIIVFGDVSKSFLWMNAQSTVANKYRCIERIIVTKCVYIISY